MLTARYFDSAKGDWDVVALDANEYAAQADVVGALTSLVVRWASSSTLMDLLQEGNQGDTFHS